MRLRVVFLILVSVFGLSALMFGGKFANSALAADDFKQRVIDRTNMYREQHGCAALTVNSKLNQSAQGHSDDMAYNDFFSHTGSNGSTLETRLKAVGYAYWSAAENIAAGYSTPEDVVDAWYNETPPNDGHRLNILNCDLQEIGVGYTYLADDTGKKNYHHYWVQDFGKPQNGVQQTATPTGTRTATALVTPSRTPAATNTPAPCSTAPSAPVLLSPAANAQVSTGAVGLDWNDTACAKKYRVQVKQDATSGPLVFKKKGIKVSQYTTPALASGTYYWRVKVCATAGCKQSGWQMFTAQ